MDLQIQNWPRLKSRPRSPNTKWKASNSYLNATTASFSSKCAINTSKNWNTPIKSKYMRPRTWRWSSNKTWKTKWICTETCSKCFIRNTLTSLFSNSTISSQSTSSKTPSTSSCTTSKFINQSVKSFVSESSISLQSSLNWLDFMSTIRSSASSATSSILTQWANTF